MTDITLKEFLETAKQLGLTPGATQETADNSGMVGKYVVVRCRDAGVHAGRLESRTGRECKLTEARRLWYWKPAKGAAFLSGVATEGLDKESKIGAPITVYLTENCEIIECTPRAEKSISAAKTYKPS